MNHHVDQEEGRRAIITEFSSAVKDSLWLNTTYMFVALAKIIATLIVMKFSYKESCSFPLKSWLWLMLTHDALQVTVALIIIPKLRS